MAGLFERLHCLALPGRSEKRSPDRRIDAIIANFQNQVAQTLTEVTANQQRGSLNAPFGADQGIRGVQTFRNPATGATMELSNQYLSVAQSIRLAAH